jgi:hypothetical protein
MPKENKQIKEQDFLEDVIKKLDTDVKADDHNRIAAIEDLKFAWGIDQWDAAEVSRRKKKDRPILQANLLPQFVDQVTGDQRHNRARINVKPVDSKADYNMARIRQGMIADIEYRSNAESIYDYASEMQTTCGYGAWRVLTRYTDENPFLQEIYLESIDNPFLVYMDCESKDMVYADARHGFVLEKLTRKEFEKRYPDAVVPGKEIKHGQGLNMEHWYDKDQVTIAEYFEVVKQEKEMCLMDDGSVLEKSEADKLIQEWEEHKIKLQALMPQMQPQVPQGVPTPSGVPFSPSPQGAPPDLNAPPPQSNQQQTPLEQFKLEPRPEIVKIRKVDMPKVKHWILTASEILSGGLEGEDVAGKYIPLVMVTGKRVNIEGKSYIRGLLRFAKDPQRLFNYSLTSAAEVVHLAPKSPWMVTPKQVDGFEKDFALANTDNLPYMKYNPDVVQGVAIPPPQRVSMGDAPVALFAEIERAEGLVRKSIGMGQRDVGQTGPERSGSAIIAAQKPSDIATFCFMDNLAKSICHCGQIINEMIPEIYDTERDARLRDVDGVERWVPINTTADKALKVIVDDPQRYQGLDKTELRKLMNAYGKKAKYNDIQEGHYGVIISVGPSYTTQRQESAQNLLMLSQNWPEIKRFAGDLLVKNMDFLGAEEIARRLEKTLPPGMKKVAPGEEPPAPMPIPPQVQLLMQKAKTEELKQQKAIADKALDMIKAKTELIKQYKEAKETDTGLRSEILKILAEIHSMPPPQVQEPQGMPQGNQPAGDIPIQ